MTVSLDMGHDFILILMHMWTLPWESRRSTHTGCFCRRCQTLTLRIN
jgi:hypothetical protein